MKRKFKIKINGESPRSILLAFLLAKLKCNVYIYDFIKNSNSKKDYRIFLFSNFEKYLLSKFDIWNEIEDISYGFTSLSIRDNLISEELLLRTENFSKKCLNTFGWIARYPDIKNLLINKLIQSDNVQFILNNQLIDESLIFDYEFNFNYYKSLNLIKSPLLTFNGIDKQILTFNVYLRGHVEKRLYEINTIYGLLVLTPINKNLYQIIWNNPPLKIKESSLNSKSFFLDNLTTLLPNELKIDQIIGDINFLPESNKYLTYLIKNKSIYFNEDKFNSNTIYTFNFDIILRIIFKIYNFLDNNDNIFIKILDRFGFSYFSRKYIEITLNFSFFNIFLNLFRVNNIFLLLFRKLLFKLCKRINLANIIFIRNINKLNIINLIK